MPELAGRLSRFGLSGLANTGLGFAVILALDLGLGLRAQIANAAGYAAGMTIGYVLSRGFVFRNTRPARVTAIRYLVAVLVSFGLNQAMVTLAGHTFGTSAEARLLAQLSGMAVYTGLLFLICEFWVFRKRQLASGVEGHARARP